SRIENREEPLGTNNNNNNNTRTRGRTPDKFTPQQSGGKKQYGGSRPLCAKCNYHHDGSCAPTASKRKLENTSRTTRDQQQQQQQHSNKRQNTGQVYTAAIWWKEAIWGI
nr:hypothetical protein [Tanacetum cinerariifolium]